MEDGMLLLPPKISEAGRLIELVDDSWDAVGEQAAKAYLSQIHPTVFVFDPMRF